MIIIQIPPIKNNSPEVLINRILLLTILIFFIFCTVVSAWAQNAVIQVYDPQSLVLKTSSLLQMHFPGLENNFSLPIQRELEAYYSSFLSQTESKESANAGSNREVFKLLYNKPKVDEKVILRREWEEAFGFDVWAPYYKYKKIEKLIKKKLSVQVFKFKGEPLVEKGNIFYVFAVTF